MDAIIICVEYLKSLIFLKISPKYDILALYRDDIYRYSFKFERISCPYSISFKNANNLDN